MSLSLTYNVYDLPAVQISKIANLQQRFFRSNDFASLSTQASTVTKSETKLGMEHLKMASFPRIMCSLLISVW